MIARLKTLHRRYKSLNSRIDKEQARPKPNGFYLSSLKKMRVLLRDRIVAVERLLSSGGRGESLKS